MDSDGAMPSCLSGIHVGQDSSRNKFTSQIRGGGVPEPHSFHLGLTLSHCSGTPGLKGFAREKGRQFFCFVLFSEKHQLFVLWPPISMLLLEAKCTRYKTFANSQLLWNGAPWLSHDGAFSELGAPMMLQLTFSQPGNT